MTVASYTQLILGLLVSLVGCQTSESPELPARSAFTNDQPPDYLETEPIGRSASLMLTRPRFSGGEIAKIAHSVAEVITDAPLPLVEPIPADRLEGRVWLTIETGEDTLEFNYYPEHPSVMVGIIDRLRMRSRLRTTTTSFSARHPMASCWAIQN